LKKQPLNILRLIVEIIAAIALAEVGVMFLLSVLAPGVEGMLETMLDATLLSIFAGPVILWRLVARLRRADADLERANSAKPWKQDLAAVGVFTLGLAVTGAAVVGSNMQTRQRAEAQFEQVSERLVREAERRVNKPQYGLAGARGMYATTTSVDRGQFAAYFASRDIAKEFPGTLGFGFIQRVMRSDLAEFITAERADGAPDFEIRSLAEPGSPVEHAPDLYVIKHCFPNNRNASSWGLDIGSEPNRRVAAEQAARSGEPAITRRISLVQDTTHRSGLLYLMPVYKQGSRPTTPDERLAALTGLLFAPIILDEAMEGLTATALGEVNFEIFDGDLTTPESRLYDSVNAHDAAIGATDALHSGTKMFSRVTSLTVGARNWTIVTSSTPRFEAGIDRSMTEMTGMGGALLSLLGAATVWTLATGRTRAILLAQGITADLSAAKTAADRLAEIAKRTSNAVVITDPHGCIEWVNEGFTRISGYALDEVKGKKPGHVLQGPDSDPVMAARMSRAVLEGSSANVEIVNYGKDGRSYVMAIEITPLRSATGTLTGFMAIESDVTAQRAASEALRVERERLELAAYAAQLGLLDWNPQTGAVLYNQRWANMFGYSLEELESDVSEWSKRVHPDDLPGVTASVRDAMSNNTPYQSEHRMRHRDGSWRWILDQGRIVNHDEQGEVTRFVGVHLDVTERKQAEEKLLKITERLKLATNAGGVGTWDYSVTDNGLTWDDQMFRLYGHADSHSLPAIQAWKDGPHPDDRARVQNEMDQAVRGEKDFNTEFRIRWPDGTTRHILAIAVVQHDATGRPARMVGTNWDITDVRLAEEKLRATSAALEEAQSVARLGNWSFDLASGRVEWSRQVFELFERDERDGPPDFAGVLSDYCPESAAVLAAAVKRTAESATPYSLNLRTSKHGKGARHVRGEGRARLDLAGKVIGMFGTVADISAEIEASESLTKARVQAEAASKAKSEFLANMSHEIRTPLTAILGFTDLLREEANAALTPQERAQTINTIKHAGTHLLTVINDILDLSKIEADKLVIEKTDTALLPVLRDIESLLRPRAIEKGLTLDIVLAGPVPEHVASDATRLRQILMNLAGNAVKFTDKGGVTVTVDTAELDGQQKLIIDTSDTGPGITPEQAARLFQPFQQADASLTRKHGGTGLGLTICRRLAVLMGGNVEISRTEPGHGSCFRLTLPMDPISGTTFASHLGAAVATQPQSPAASMPSVNGRILLAEDGLDNQRLISFHLKRAGATVEIADNGRIALEMLDRAAADGKPFDLLLTDMQMPEMDGYALARSLRARSSTLAIVALTAHAMAEDREKCLRAGCDDYATKPIQQADLIAICAAWVGKVGGNKLGGNMTASRAV